MDSQPQPSPPKGPLILSILIISVGVGWLLTVKNVVPGINWVWTLSLAAIGILTFVLSRGLDKFTIVVGPLFLITSLLSVLRQLKQLTVDVEIPTLVIVLDVLLLVAQFRAIPTPAWLIASPVRKTN
jgi:hypothetical protein